MWVHVCVHACLFVCFSGCRTEWDEVRCWYRADVGQIVNVSCSDISLLFANKGNDVQPFTFNFWPYPLTFERFDPEQFFLDNMHLLLLTLCGL